MSKVRRSATALAPEMMCRGMRPTGALIIEARLHPKAVFNRLAAYNTAEMDELLEETLALAEVV